MSMTVSRSSNQSVIAHHWSPAYPQPDREDDIAASVYLSYDTVVAYNYECSVPLPVTVREVGDQFRVEGLPHRCPVCQRPFSPYDQKRLRNAAIAGHLLAWGDIDSDAPILPQDVILDI